jgi:hypothetical protein
MAAVNRVRREDQGVAMMKHAPKVGRNDLCPCGSGRKYKRCCETKVEKRGSRLLLIGVGGAVLAALIFGLSEAVRDPVATGPRRVWDAAHGHYHDVR